MGVNIAIAVNIIPTTQEVHLAFFFGGKKKSIFAEKFKNKILRS
jgi:hypothetical protein